MNYLTPNSFPPVLYVEDEENDVFLVEYGFKKAGLNQPLQVVINGRDAMDYLAGVGAFSNRDQFPLPCLILLDLNLPLVSGLEVLKWVRDQAAFRELPVVIFTSSEQPTDIEQGRRLGANDYLIKPSDPDDYVALAHRLKETWLAEVVKNAEKAR